MKISRTLVINDIHGPFHDPRLIDENGRGVVLEVAENLLVDRIVVAGDCLDLINMSSHDNGRVHPQIQVTLEDELEWGREFFYNLRARFPKTEIVFLYGNHEDRYDRAVVKDHKKFYDRLKLHLELNLEHHNIIWYDYNTRYQLEQSKLYIQHSPASYSSPQANLKTYPDTSSIFGCSHRVGHACHNGKDEIFHCYFNGWLSTWDLTPEHERVFRYRKNHAKWQNVLSIVTCIDGKNAYNTQHLIEDYRVIVDGFVFEG
jgi:hypothetical protein